LCFLFFSFIYSLFIGIHFVASFVYMIRCNNS
jgi:hypothetical protein